MTAIVNAILALLFVAIVGTRSAGAEVVHFSSAAPVGQNGNNTSADRIWGHFDKPAGLPPFPAVVLMHGCNGLHKSTARWAAILNEVGYATLNLDSFGPRSIFSVCTGKGNRASPNVRALDAFGALNFLRQHPDIADNRIAVAGWSHGAIAALAAVAASGLSRNADWQFAAAVAFYPYCIPDRRYAIPALILIGDADDWTPAAPCRALHAQSLSEGGSVEVVIYPGARHGFDEVSLRQEMIFEGAYGQKHRLKYDANAHRDSIARVSSFLTKHLGN